MTPRKSTAVPRKKTASPRSGKKLATVAKRGRGMSAAAQTTDVSAREARRVIASPSRSAGRGAEPVSLTGESKRGAKKKGKKARLARADFPYPCSILAVDPGALSGWSLWMYGALDCFGECDVFGDEPKRVIERLLKLPGPHVVVVERPFMVRSTGSTGMGTGDKIWREAAKRLGLERRTVRVYPSQWRAVVLPKGMANAKRAVVRPEEMKLAKPLAARFKLELFDVMADAAPAILIGEWASKAGEVLRVLPKPKRVKDTTVPGSSVKFGRFAIRSKARKRIERATDGDACLLGTWLVVDGKSIQRTERIERATLERAEVRIGFKRAYTHPELSHFDAVTHVHVPYRATSEQIEAGWNEVAAMVERQEGFDPKAKRPRKTKRAA